VKQARREQKWLIKYEQHKSPKGQKDINWKRVKETIRKSFGANK
jgi:hypothetical protein